MNIRQTVSFPFSAARLALLSVAFLGIHQSSQGAAAIPVVLSTDVGNEVDDQWAITYLLTNPHFKVQGLLSAQAPSLPDPSAHATYLVLRDVVEHKLSLSVHPPILEGASIPLRDSHTPSPSPASRFLIETARSYTKDNPLTVLTIGAATDVASALLAEPALAERIRVVAMGFTNLSAQGGKEYNVQNDPHAWQAILNSAVPVVIGSGDVCRHDLALSFSQAKAMLADRGAIGAWLWREYQDWYFRNVKPLRVNDFSKPWIIWDIITLAYLENMATSKEIGRPHLSDDLGFTEGQGRSSVATTRWITSVDAARLWADFLMRLDEFQATHAALAEP